MELDIRTTLAVATLFAVILGNYFYLKFHSKQLKIDIDKNEVADKERETKLTKKIDDLGKAAGSNIKNLRADIEKDTTALRDNLKTIFSKLDMLSDNHANAIGDLRVVLTVMAGKLNPGNDKALIEMIRDIGKKHNGRR